MAFSTRSIDILLRQITDTALQGQLQTAVDALRQQTQFGLVFEGHHPEVSRLNGFPIKAGALVTRRLDQGNQLLRVATVRNLVANCYPASEEGASEPTLQAVPVDDLVACKRFGEAIFPSLTKIDAMGAADGKPWHLLIEADNYHALQLLAYTHRHKVDVIYIDPPYNTGAKDWKYNNDYVDDNDPWRHSKWLSFMEKRLELAELLLKPDGVLVVTIDEHEVHHLACLLEQMFRDSYHQMVTIVINPAGVTQGRFSRVEEHALFVFKGGAKVYPGADDFLTSSATEVGAAAMVEPQWESLLRRGTGARRSDRQSMFYPVIIDPKRKAVVGVGEPLPLGQSPDLSMLVEGLPVAWPIRTDLSEGRWKVGAALLRTLIQEGFVRLGRYDPKRKTWGLTYATRKIRKELEEGQIVIRGRDEVSGALDLVYKVDKTRPPRTVWNRTLHNAGPHGTDFLRLVFGQGEKFPFPKSVYSVRDTLSTLVKEKKDAVILDFFGGSGTTYNAVALLNSLDGGRRQSITVTNNEVSEVEAKRLADSNLRPGDPDWERHGICQAVTWPRMKFVTRGSRDDGTPLPGEYFTGVFEHKERPVKISQVGIDGVALSTQQRKDVVRMMPELPMNSVKPNSPYALQAGKPVAILWDIDALEPWLIELEEIEGITDVFVFTSDKRKFSQVEPAIRDAIAATTVPEEQRAPLKEGLRENVAYLRLGFLDPDDVASGEALEKLLPVLWMVSGACGECPSAGDNGKWIISSENKMAILLKEKFFQEFLAATNDMPLDHVFLVTDALDAFKEMNAQIKPTTKTHMLYTSYLQNFRISAGGGAA